MGTGFDMTVHPEELGVIPRAVQDIFSEIEERKSSAREREEPLPQFEVKAQFLEACYGYVAVKCDLPTTYQSLVVQ